MNDNTNDTTNLLSFYSNLATDPDLQAAIRKHFGSDDADNILLHMTSGAKLEDDKAEEVSDFILEFLDDNAVLIDSYKGTGELTQEGHEAFQQEFRSMHPGAADLVDKQLQGIQDLGLLQNFSMMSGRLEPFDIEVLEYGGLFIVRAAEFEASYFQDGEQAKLFAQSNYCPWIINYESHI